jgi:hypothetical protein
MKNLFEPATVNEIRADGTSQAGQRTAVGKMSVAQMLAHGCGCVLQNQA